MRLTSVCADPGIRLDRIKGATIHLTSLWRALALEGAAVTGIAGIGGGPVAATLDGVTVVPVEGTGGEAFEERILAAALGSARERPDAVLERLALGSEVGRLLARTWEVPLLVEVNAPLDEEEERYRGRTPSGETLERQRRLLGSADLVCVVSAALADYACSRGARPDRVRVLANGVEVARFAGPRPARRAGEAVRVGFVGAFRPWHGLELLIEACGGLHDQGIPIELVLLGDGPIRVLLERKAAAWNCPVSFLGERPHEEVPAFLREVDVAVVAAPPDLDYYFSPLKLYEYAAAGCAIVAPRAGQVAMRFRHQEDAWLVRPGDATALAEALRRLALDPPLRERLGQAARRRAHEEFDWRIVARTLLDWVRERRAAPAEER